MNRCIVIHVIFASLWMLALKARSNNTPLVWNQKPVRIVPKDGPSDAKIRWETLAETKKRKQSQITSISTNRRACNFYLWDFLSASLYHTCKLLMKDCVYEGRGGRKFVRIEPGSLLQLLYPLSRHSPDKCVFCGGTYRDHLTLSWSKHLYTPYDLYMDRTFDNGVLQRVEVTKPTSSASRRGRTLAAADDTPTMRFAFHTRYVLDVQLFLQSIPKGRDRMRKLQQAIAESPQLSVPAQLRVVEPVKTVYFVSRLDPLPKWRACFSFLSFIRSRFLSQLDNLILLQEKENSLLRELEMNNRWAGT